MTEPTPAALPVSAPRVSPRRSERNTRIVAWGALALAFVGGWIAIDARVGERSFESSATGRLAEVGAELQQSKANLAQAQAALKEAQGRIQDLEGRVADTQEQRAAIEEMYRELSRSADDRLLSEVEQLLVLASQQLQLAGNVRAALVALQAADQRLARAEKLAATPLRRAITQDMDRLKAVPQVDTVGLAVKLDGLIAQTDALPLVISETAPVARVSRVRADESAMARAARDFWDEMKGLVRIRELDTPDVALLAPQQAYFLRENLKLRLLSARVALLARDESSFREDVRLSQAWIGKYFDTKARGTATALATLKQVGESPVAIAVPDINASLAAVRTARAAREKR
ncbi:MAG TPA: uroporphyrinogen-III C-methyltransferase [Usitatibacter sp.]|nr:uroporphyrinogen-III C-methyltransferase [Usitatibacter sp.]